MKSSLADCLQIQAQKFGIPRDSFTYIQCDLGAFESVRKFIDDFRSTGRPLDALVCNAAVYLPVDKEPSFSADGYELSVAVNHLGHFLLANELLPDIEKSDHKRLIIVGSITGNDNTIAGNIPPRADLGNLEGFEAGFKSPICMINGGEWEAPKAYKDAKVCSFLCLSLVLINAADGCRKAPNHSGLCRCSPRGPLWPLPAIRPREE